MMLQKTISTACLILFFGLTAYSQNSSSNVFEAIQNPDHIEFLRISCPHHFPDQYPCDTVPSEIVILKRLKTFAAIESRFCCLPETFNELDSLEIFELSENENFLINELCKLVGLVSLKTLQLSSMDVSELPSCLSQITSLESVWLNLYGLKYSQAIPVLAELPKLTSLNLMLAEDQNFPNEIQQLKSLEYLRLDYSSFNIEELVSACSNMNLKGLSLAENLLEELPGNFSKMKSLVGLDLSGNIFDSIPSEIIGFESLRFLSLRDNSKHSQFYLSDKISNLKHLEYLDLSDNKINQLPQEIIKLNNLKFLNIYRTNINDLTSLIPKLKSLQQLNVDLNENNVEEIEELKKLCPNLIISSLMIGELEETNIIEMVKK